MTLAAESAHRPRLHSAAAAAAFMPIGDFSSFKRKRADSDRGRRVISSDHRYLPQSCLVQVDLNGLFSLGWRPPTRSAIKAIQLTGA